MVPLAEELGAVSLMPLGMSSLLSKFIHCCQSCQRVVLLPVPRSFQSDQMRPDRDWKGGTLSSATLSLTSAARQLPLQRIAMHIAACCGLIWASSKIFLLPCSVCFLFCCPTSQGGWAKKRLTCACHLMVTRTVFGDDLKLGAVPPPSMQKLAYGPLLCAICAFFQKGLTCFLIHFIPRFFPASTSPSTELHMYSVS